MAPSADGTSTAVIYDQGPPRLYDLTRSLRRPHRLAQLESRDGAVTALAVSPGRRVLGAGAGGVATLWELRGRKQVARIATGAGRLTDVAISLDSRRGLVGGGDGSVRVLDLEAGREARRVDLGAGAVNSVDLADDARLALGAGPEAIVLFDAVTGEERRRIPPPAGATFSWARLGAGEPAVVASCGNQVFLFDPASGAELRRFEAGVPVNSVDIAPAAAPAAGGRGGAERPGRLVAAACDDGAVRVWDSATGAAVRRIAAHAGPVQDLSFLGDGRTVVSGGDDRALCLVDLDTGKVIRRLRTYDGGLAAITVSRDGAFALSTSDDGAVLIWPLIDASVSLDPPADLAQIYDVIRLRVVAAGETRGAIEPIPPTGTANPRR
jgi:WD40 repeat protein